MNEITVACVNCSADEIVYMNPAEPFECEDHKHCDFVCPTCKAIVTVNVSKGKERCEECWKGLVDQLHS